MSTSGNAPEPGSRLDYILTLAELAAAVSESEQALLRQLEPEGTFKLRGNRVGILPPYVRSFLRERGVDYSFQVIAHINLKGGVGKTTSTISLATRAAQYGFRTCILDMDSQGSATLAFGVTPQEDEPIFIDIWHRPGDMLMAALHEIQPGLYLLPSALENGLLDISLSNPASQKNAVRGICDVLRENAFDLVLIDCPPSLGAAVISSACAADLIVIPVGFDTFSLKGLQLTVNELNAIHETFGLPKPELNVLYTLFDRRVKQSTTTLKKLTAQYGERLIPVPIRTSTQFSKATNTFNTVFAAPGQRSTKEDYDHCLRHLLNIRLG